MTARSVSGSCRLSRNIDVTVDLKTLPKAQYLTECVDAETGAGQYNSGMYCNPEIDELWQQLQETHR